MRRTFVASALPAFAITLVWLSLEEPRVLREGLAVVAIALAPALVRRGVARLAAVALAVLVAAWISFGAQPWELSPFRDERVLAPALRDAARGTIDFYEVFLPFEPTPNPEMHSLVLCAVFGFVLATGLLVAARRPLAAAAVTVAGIGWPATLLGGQAVAVGALALAAALAVPLILRATSIRTVLVGATIGVLVVAGAALTASTTTLARQSALEWETWDIRGAEREASAVRFVWDSDYGGIRFPAEKTVVLRVEGPATPHYWRTTTLDRFAEDRWYEDLFWLGQVDRSTSTLPLPQLIPRRARNREEWLEQEVRVEALVDDHLAAAGTPVALDSRRLDTVFQLSGGVLRSRGPISPGERYRVWSYVPTPSPRSLAEAPVRLPPLARRFLGVDAFEFPPFGASNRGRIVQRMLTDPSYFGLAWERPMYDAALRVAGRAETPYAAVLALESWFRQTGGFRYDESPPRVKGSPLVAFVTRTKAGYCQHFAGAMAVMLRMLGIPARVAVGFTSGTQADGEWIVTDHEAHAWVEVWFAGLGWIPFDPTPGRGTLGGEYTFASGSQAAIARLRRGELGGSAAPQRPTRARDAGPRPDEVLAPNENRTPSLVGVVLVLAAAWIVVLGAGKAVRRRARYFSRDPRAQATASRRELEDFLRDQGADVPLNATLATLQQAVREEFGLDARPFALAASRVRFGPPESVASDAPGPRRELRRLLRAARGELSVWARFRGLVSVRSLRSANS